MTSRKSSVPNNNKKKTLKPNDAVHSHPCGKCSKACLDEINCSNDGDFSIECDNCMKWFHRKCLDDMLSDKEWESLTGQNPSILFKCTLCVDEKVKSKQEMKEIKKEINNEISELRGRFEEFQNILQDNNKTLINELEKAIMPKVESIIDQRINNHTEKLDKIYEAKFNNLEKEMKQNKIDNDSKEKEINQQFEDRIKKLENATNESTSESKPTQANLEKMIKDVKTTETNIERKIENELKVYLDQKQDKERRKNNIIILRLEEAEGENEEEKINNDRKSIKKLLNITNPELEAELDTIIPKKSSLRLGRKKEGANRPIKLTLTDEEMKKDIFKGCRNLKNSNFKHVSIQNDLSREEQEKNFKLRQELRGRKEKGEKVCIFQNEIIEEKDHPRNKHKHE